MNFYEKERDIDREAEMNLNNTRREIAMRENHSRREVPPLSMRVHLSFQSSMALYIMHKTTMYATNPRREPRVLFLILYKKNLIYKLSEINR